MYSMMIHRGKYKDFDTVQSCIDAMIENGFMARKIYFLESGILFSRKISIDGKGNANVGRKNAERI